jgi:hypothetical protein
VAGWGGTIWKEKVRSLKNTSNKLPGLDGLWVLGAGGRHELESHGDGVGPCVHPPPHKGDRPVRTVYCEPGRGLLGCEFPEGTDGLLHCAHVYLQPRGLDQEAAGLPGSCHGEVFCKVPSGLALWGLGHCPMWNGDGHTHLPGGQDNGRRQRVNCEV